MTELDQILGVLGVKPTAGRETLKRQARDRRANRAPNPEAQERAAAKRARKNARRLGEFDAGGMRGSERYGRDTA